MVDGVPLSANGPSSPASVPAQTNNSYCTDCAKQFRTAAGLQQHSSSKKHKKRAQQKTGTKKSTGPVEEFFFSHAFAFDRYSNYEDEFESLCIERGWPLGGSQITEARKKFRAAQVKAFGSARVDRTSRVRKIAIADAIRDFFEGYAPAFKYNPANHHREEFENLCRVHHWRPNDDEWKEAKRLLNKAEVKDFEELFGTDPNDPEAWRRLCETAGINPVPKGLEGRRRVRPLSLRPPSYVLLH